MIPKVDELSLEEKVGQLLLAPYSSSEEYKAIVNEYKIGNFLFFENNVRTKEQTMKEVKEIHSLCSRIKPILAIDEEGGNVQRIRWLTEIPSPLAINATGKIENIGALSKIKSEELKEIGFNLNLGPVCDINVDPRNPVIGSRSFGDDATSVAQYASEFIKHHKIACCAKHFPGHGDVCTDSHLSAPFLNRTKGQLIEREFIPFAEAIKAGVDFVMVAHMNVLGQSAISSLDHETYRQLREDLCFNGIIITDGIEMKALPDPATSAVAALKAGADLICIGAKSFLVKDIAQALLSAASQGEIPDLDEKVSRILKFKEEKFIEIEEKASLNCNYLENQKISDHISARSITVIGKIPCVKDKKVLVISSGKLTNGSFAFNLGASTCSAEFLAENINGNWVSYKEDDPSDDELKQIFLKARLYEEIIVILSWAGKTRKQLHFHDLSPIYVTAPTPFDISILPEGSNVIVAYELSQQSLREVSKVLIGEKKASGHLPFHL